MQPQEQMVVDIHPLEPASHRYAPIKVYLMVWFWLFVLSFTAYLVELISEATHLVLWFKWSLLVLIALMKGGLIVAYFMHLRFERLSLVYAIVVPSLLFLALAAGFLPDAWSIITFWSRP